MLNSAHFSAVAVDGGTTNTRARLIRGGRVVATARRAVGVRDSLLSDQPSPVAAAVYEAIEEVVQAGGGARPDLIVAAGMLSSEVGLVCVPHVPAPAGVDELARAVQTYSLPGLADRPIAIVPGVRTPASAGRDGWMEADVLRGEECETLGAWDALPETRGNDVAFLWPGSHTKLVAVDRSGRIVRSHTTLAGELTAALARHTLLAASLPPELPAEPPRDAVQAGARAAGCAGLGRAAFLVRVAALTQSLGADERAAFWIGAVIGEDVRWLAAHPILSGGRSVWVGGREPQRSLYARWLEPLCHGPVHALDDDLAECAAAFGALAIALRRHVSPG